MFDMPPTTPIRGQSVFQQINVERASNKLPPLRPSAELVKAAQAKADAMANSGIFSHRNEKGSGNLWSYLPITSGYKNAGENLATGFSTTEALTKAWMNSQSHKSNILAKDFTDTGIAISKGKNGQVYVVQYFGGKQ